jgi:hypothetical protein
MMPPEHKDVNCTQRRLKGKEYRSYISEDIVRTASIHVLHY